MSALAGTLGHAQLGLSAWGGAVRGDGSKASKYSVRRFLLVDCQPNFFRPSANFSAVELDRSRGFSSEILVDEESNDEVSSISSCGRIIGNSTGTQTFTDVMF